MEEIVILFITQLYVAVIIIRYLELLILVMIAVTMDMTHFFLLLFKLIL
jgi:hypothetical protein